MANKPTNPQLYSRVKAEAKKKFDRWPSAYGSAWLVKEYKRRGGGYRTAKDGMEIPGYDLMANGGMMYGDYYFPMMDEGGEMALGQIAAVTDKMSKLQQFLNPNSEVEPWIASKLAVMDHSADAIYDYMMYNPEAQDSEEGESEEPEMEEMRNGGIPPRYKNMGFNKVGAKKQSTRPGKKWMVLAKKGDKYKVVHGGYKGMKDFTQHRNENRRDRFWNRMGGRNSAKATDPFSPLYWHKRFGTWAEGGEPQNEGFQALPQEVQAKIMANMMYGGDMYAMGGMPCYECGGQMKYKKGGTPFIAMAYFEDGGIKIDPAKKGTFKAQATRMGMSVQEAAEAILNAPKGKYSPEMRRKANFARNFAKEYGGMMEYQMGGSGMGNMYMNQMEFDMLQAGLPESRISPDLATMREYQLNEQEAPAGFVSDMPAPTRRGAGSGMGQMALDNFAFNQAMAEPEAPEATEPELDFSAFEDMGPQMEVSDNEKVEFIPGRSKNMYATKDFVAGLRGPKGGFNPFIAGNIGDQSFRVQTSDIPKLAMKAAKNRYADYSTAGKGFKSATNALGDLVSLGSWFGKGAKDAQARRDAQRRTFTDNLYSTMPAGVTGQRGDYDIMGNFRPDETLASRTYMSEAYMQMGGEIEMTDDQIRQLVALGAEIEILD
jgi:hypothetical protein